MIRVFKEPNFKKCLTELKDSPEQHNSIQINYPIRSLIIQSIPNDLWMFTQEFSLVVYLKHDPMYKVELKVPRGSGVINYKIQDTKEPTQHLDWMARYEPKIVVFTVGQYDPSVDITLARPPELVSSKSPLVISTVRGCNETVVENNAGKETHR